MVYKIGNMDDELDIQCTINSTFNDGGGDLNIHLHTQGKNEVPSI